MSRSIKGNKILCVNTSLLYQLTFGGRSQEKRERRGSAGAHNVCGDGSEASHLPFVSKLCWIPDVRLASELQHKTKCCFAGTDVPEVLDRFSCISWSGLRHDMSLLIHASAREATQAVLGGKECACAVNAVVSRPPAKQLGDGNVSRVFGKSWVKPFLAQINSLLLPLRQCAFFLSFSALVPSCASVTAPAVTGFTGDLSSVGEGFPASWTQCSSSQAETAIL